MMHMRILIALTAGFLIDCILGDRQWMWHPVRIIGRLIASLEKIIRSLFPKTERGELSGGAVMAFAVCALSFGVPLLVLAAAALAGWQLLIAAETVCCYFLLAARSLRDESMKVYRAAAKGDTEGARLAVSMIVGRDTERLDADGIVRAAVETVAENTSDGVIAPMFWTAVGGVPLGFFYKAVNTMDSMVGYNNDKYRYFGRCAAKLDDIMNFIPARISGVLIIAASALPGTEADARGARRIFLRDRMKHASPNSAQTEAAMAGALGLRLAGDAWYFGKRKAKPYIGDDTRPVNPHDIILADRIMYLAGILGLILCILGRMAVIYLMGAF